MGFLSAQRGEKFKKKNLKSLLADPDIFSSYILSQELICKYEKFKAAQ